MPSQQNVQIYSFESLSDLYSIASHSFIFFFLFWDSSRKQSQTKEIVSF